MIATAPQPKSSWSRLDASDWLENGAHFSASEFLRRYEKLPEDEKAELVNGVVYMAPPVRFEQHAEPDSLIQTWLGVYGIATPGVKSGTNSTIRLGPDDVPQPDGLLRIIPERGGRSRVDARGYIEGPPELLVEVAASSASLDTREKRASYRRAGVREYLVWRTLDAEIDWWMLEEDEYRPVPLDADGIMRSQVFPGLWLAKDALLAGDGQRLLAVLNEGLRHADHSAFTAELARRQSDGPTA